MKTENENGFEVGCLMTSNIVGLGVLVVKNETEFVVKYFFRRGVLNFIKYDKETCGSLRTGHFALVSGVKHGNE